VATKGITISGTRLREEYLNKGRELPEWLLGCRFFFRILIILLCAYEIESERSKDRFWAVSESFANDKCCQTSYPKTGWHSSSFYSPARRRVRLGRRAALDELGALVEKALT